MLDRTETEGNELLARRQRVLALRGRFRTWKKPSTSPLGDTIQAVIGQGALVPLVSRVKEFEAVLGIVRGSQGRALALIGQRGCGKTTVINAVNSAFGKPVARIRGNRTETYWPLAGISAFLSAIDASQGTESLSVLQTGNLHDSPFELAQRIDGLLRDAALGHFVVFIDDVDHFDDFSQKVLGYVIRRMTATGMCTILSMETMAHDGAFSGMDLMLLGPLDVPTLIDLGKSIAPSTASLTVLDYVAHASSGNPLALKSILGALPRQCVDGEAPLPVPIRPGNKLIELVTERLGSLSDAARSSLNVLSCCSYLPESIYKGLPGASMEELEQLIAGDIVMRVAGNLIVKQPAVSSTTYWSLPASERLRLHGELADACRESHPGLFAWHATCCHLPENHSGALLTAATVLVDRGYIHAGVEFAELALSTNEDNISEQLVKLVESFILRSEYDLGLRYLKFARKMCGPGAVPPALGACYVFLDYVQYQTVSAQGVADTITRYSASDPTGCARLLCVTALCRLERWELPAARALVEEAISLVGHTTNLTAATAAVVQLYDLALTGGDLPDNAGFRALRQVLHKAFWPPISGILVARVLSLSERYSDARELLNDVLDQVSCGDRVWTDLALQVQISNEYRAGLYHRARAALESLDARGYNRRSFEVHRLVMDATRSSASGDAVAATAAIKGASRLLLRGKNPALDALIAVRQGRIAMLSRDYENAVPHFARARLLGVDLGNPQLLRYHGDYIESLLFMDQHNAALEVFQELKEGAAAAPSRWANHVVAWCEALLLEGENSVQALATLLGSWADAGNEYLRARALFSYSYRLKQSGYDRASAEVRQDAENIFHDIGIGSNFELCHDDQGNSEVSQTLELLDHKELQVVTLLAKGYKNQTIAHEIFVSVRTVELRLTNIYRKFGVKSRFELMKLLSDVFKD